MTLVRHGYEKKVSGRGCGEVATYVHIDMHILICVDIYTHINVHM